MYDIITYCSKGHEKALLKFLPSWLRTEVCKIHIYSDHHHNLSSLDSRVELYSIFGDCSSAGVGCARKAEAINVHRYRLIRPTILLDVDCFINQDLGVVFDDTFDIGVAVNPRCKPKSRLRNVSGGLLFINNTEEAKVFIQRWVEKQWTAVGPSRDQACLSRAAMEQKCRIKEFSEDIYNCHPYTNTPHDIQDWINRAKSPMDLDQVKQGINHILHFAHKTWKILSPEQVLGI